MEVSAAGDTVLQPMPAPFVRSPIFSNTHPIIFQVASEEPMINGIFGMQYTRGVQEGEDSRYLKTVVTLKHWDAYSEWT